MLLEGLEASQSGVGRSLHCRRVTFDPMSNSSCTASLMFLSRLSHTGTSDSVEGLCEACREGFCFLKVFFHIVSPQSTLAFEVVMAIIGSTFRICKVTLDLSMRAREKAICWGLCWGKKINSHQPSTKSVRFFLPYFHFIG